MAVFSFSKKERLLKRKDFVNLNKRGMRINTENFLITFGKNDMQITRLGVSVSRKIKKAVRRNRIKRLIREFFRLNKRHIPKGYDILITAKTDLSSFKLKDVEKELKEVLIEKAHLFC